MSRLQRWHLVKSRKQLINDALATPFARELTDVLVIFSICLVAYKAVTDWGGLSLLHAVLGTQTEKPSFLYFFGMALVLFTLRRIGDQRSERAKRLAAERDAQTASMRDPLTQLPNRRQFQGRRQCRVERFRQQNECPVARYRPVQEAQ